jgi:hypothetical protein
MQRMQRMPLICAKTLVLLLMGVEITTADSNVLIDFDPLPTLKANGFTAILTLQVYVPCTCLRN